MGLQVGRFDGHWLSIRHSTHVACPIGIPATARVRQNGVAAGQSPLTAHATQKCPAEHTGVAVPAQFALLVHWTHVEEATSQRGAAVEH